MIDPELTVQHLGHRGQAVCGAGGVTDDVVLGGLVDLGVDTDAHGRVDFALARSAEDDLLGASLDMSCGLLARAEAAGTLQNDVNP